MKSGMDRPSRERTPRPGQQPAQTDGPIQSGAGSAARRGVRTVVLSAVALVGLMALAVGVLITSVGPPEGSTPGPGRAGQDARPGPGVSPSEAEGGAIAGTVSVAPELRGRLAETDTLFIIAHKGPGAPFAVRRISGPRFPLAYRLGAGDVMMAGAPFQGEMALSARVSKTGGAGPAQPGDLEGEHAGRVGVGARGVDIVITRVH